MALIYNINCNDYLGRYLVAARDIKQGEVIMKEQPRLLGSPIAAFPICFKCAGRIYTASPPKCKDCGTVPICGNCNGTQHDQECKTTEQLRRAKVLNLRFLMQNPQVCLALRCLLMKLYDPPAWEEFMQLESHLAARRGSDIYHLHKLDVERPLRTAGILEYMQLNDADDVISKICGVLDVNNFEVRPLEYCEGPDDCLRGVYLKPALMSHNCIRNTHLSVDENFLMTIRASVRIAEGEIISFNYTNGLQGNIDRQKHLQEGKYFTCTCRRCKDPTELQTGLSTMMCPRCKKAAMVHHNNEWKCMECREFFNSKMIDVTLSFAKEKVQKILQVGTLTEAKHLVDAFLGTFHPQHGLIIELMQKIITLLNGHTDIPSIMEKITLCEKLCKVLAIIEPGISRHQGITQYEHHNAKLLLGKTQYNASQITLEAYLEILTEGEAILKSAIGHLIYEPKGTPEGRLAQRALTDMQVLRGTIKDLRTKAERKAKKQK